MIPLVAASYNDADRDTVRDAIRQLGSDDARTDFERAVAARLGAAGAVATPSGTTALHLAMLALGLDADSRVGAPSYTCAAIAHAVGMVGAELELLDNLLEPKTGDYNLDARDVHRLASLDCLIVPHAFGTPAELPDDVFDVVPVIEDIAMSFGATYANGAPVGSRGLLATVSFHESKMISTGAGGAVIAPDRTQLDSVRTINGLSDEHAAARRSVTIPRLSSRSSYELPGLSAALGISQLRRLDRFIERRRSIAGAYDDVLRRLGVIDITRHSGDVVHRYVVPCPLGKTPAEAIGFLRTQGIEAGRGVFPALHQMIGSAPETMPNAERATAENVSVPVYPGLDDGEVDDIVAALEVLYS